MSYAGMGIAIPAFRGSVNRNVTFTRGVTARSRGLGSVAAPPTASSAQAAAAMAAVAAVMLATPEQRRSPLAAVRAFQQAYGRGLTVDGIYGPNTRAALVSVTGRSDLPSTSSGGGSTMTTPYVSSSSPVATPEVVPTETSMVDTSSLPSWLVPVTVVGVVVTVAGAIIMRRRPKSATVAAAPVRSRRR